MRKIIIKFSLFLLSVVMFFSLASYSGLYIQTVSPYIRFCKLEKNCTGIPKTKPPSDKILYKGENGKDALTVLREREKAWIEQDKSGMITSINNRKADESKHEFWAFYVNGKMAKVGSVQYITKDSDVIEWRISTY